MSDDVQDMRDATSRLDQLRPVTFRYRQPLPDGTRPVQYGLIAEEVARVYRELAVSDPATRKIVTVRHDALTPMLLNELQLQNKELSRRATEITGLAAAVADLRAEIAALRRARGTRRRGSNGTRVARSSVRWSSGHVGPAQERQRFGVRRGDATARGTHRGSLKPRRAARGAASGTRGREGELQVAAEALALDVVCVMCYMM